MGMHDSREEIDKQQRLHVLRNMKKVFKVADLRDLDSRVSIGEISYSRMVEILNEKAYEVYSKEHLDAPPVSVSFCEHPLEHRMFDFKNFPWCMKCGKRM